MLLHVSRLMTYDMLPPLHQVLFTITYVAVAIIAVLIAITLITIFLSFVGDWIRNLFS